MGNFLSVINNTVIAVVQNSEVRTLTCSTIWHNTLRCCWVRGFHPLPPPNKKVTLVDCVLMHPIFGQIDRPNSYFGNLIWPFPVSSNCLGI
jgi:hypothetical protein